jgi:hypothetical protein
VLVTFGGLGNAITYIFNEGWYPCKSEIEMDTTSLSQDTNHSVISIHDSNEPVLK